MKQITYKIIVIASVLLGALGPQVASGSINGNSEEAVPTFTTPVQLSSIQLSDSPLDSTSVSNKEYVDLSCSSQLGSIRLDLLLWQGCGNQLGIAPQPEIPQVVVISQPTYLPTVVAQTSTSSWNLKMLLGSQDRSENSVLPMLGFSFKPEAVSKVVVLESSARLFKAASNFDQKNYMQIIVMRC